MTPHARGCHRNFATNSLSSGTAAPPMAGSCLEPAARRLNAFDITNGTCVARIIGSRGSSRYNLSAVLRNWVLGAPKKKRPHTQSTCKPLFGWPCRLDIASKARRGHTHTQRERKSMHTPRTLRPRYTLHTIRSSSVKHGARAARSPDTSPSVLGSRHSAVILFVK